MPAMTMAAAGPARTRRTDCSRRDQNVQTMDLMNRLHALDTALAACQRQAIAVDELSAVWALHCRGLDLVVGSDGEWVGALLRKIAMRHGILGLVGLPPPRPGDVAASPPGP